MSNKVTELLTAIGSTDQEWVLSQTIRNICYGTHNDTQYQDKVIADCTAEVKPILENFAGSEVDEKAMYDLQMKAERAEEQKVYFAELHVLAKAAYKELTGSDWTPTAKKSRVSKKKITASADAWKQRLAG
tara:strand:- start:614 stop:1006 length:393 start_codon:yes stop_codon:yes gene_type:complete